MTRSEETRAEVTALIKARRTALCIIASDEERTEAWIAEAAAAARQPVFYWDIATGLTDPAGKLTDAGARDPSRILAIIQDWKGPGVFVLRDVQPYLKDPTLARALRSAIRALRGKPLAESRTLVLLSPAADLPTELAASITTIEWPIPDREEIATLLDTALKSVPDDKRAGAVESRDAAIDSALGLTGDAAYQCFEKSLVATKGRIDPKLVMDAKKRIIGRMPGLTLYEPDPRGLEAVGGLDEVKRWIVLRKPAFSQDARAYGLPPPKGVFLVGVPGGGKSLIAKVIAAFYGVLLVRFDLGALSSKYVGESEGNMRRALAMVDTVAPCVLWIDEVDKALKGASGDSADGGVQADKLGSLLSWMQDRTSPAFVVATANDVRGLPPELLRKGRFDEIFWVDLPTKRERVEVLKVAVGDARRRASAWVEGEPIDYGAVADVTQGFTGAELAALVPDAMFAAFADGKRALRTADMVSAAASVVPLGKTAEQKLTELREWAKGRARFASTPETVDASAKARALDLD